MISSLFLLKIFKYRKRGNYEIMVYTGIDSKWDQSVHSFSFRRIFGFGYLSYYNLESPDVN